MQTNGIQTALLSSLEDIFAEQSGFNGSKMFRSEFSAPQVSEVHDESVATTLKVIMDVLKVSGIICLLLCLSVTADTSISTGFESAIIFYPFYCSCEFHNMNDLLSFAKYVIRTGLSIA